MADITTAELVGRPEPAESAESAESARASSEATASLPRRVAARLSLRRVLGYDALSLLALSGLAVTQPLLDLFGKNPEFFLAAEADHGEIVSFGVAVAFAVPVVAVLIELLAHAIGPRVGAASHAVLIGLLGTAFGATVARQFDFSRSWPDVLVAMGIGALILLAERRTHAMRMGLRYLAVAPLLFLALFVFTSGTSRLLWEDEAVAQTGVAVANPKPVVMIVFDELPLASLITPEGQIDAERFPNFARLARRGTWFRNATSLSPNTPGSLPTILSGLEPQSDVLPTSVDYPRNLFTLLGGSYQMDVTETITQLCPRTLCERAESPRAAGWFQLLRQNLLDASIVYGHVTLPPRLRGDLPGVDGSWGGFADGGSSADVSEPTDGSPTATPSSISTTTTMPTIDDFMTARNRQMRATQPQGTGELLRLLTTRVGTERSSQLYFVHDALLPHFNWLTTPDGHTYRGEGGPPGTVDGTWRENDFLVRQGQQRHLLQVGYADTLLGQLIDRLQVEGIWHDAVVAVTADHGIAFTPGLPKRTPADDTVDEIYRVPMIIRVPGEREGEVSDENALLDDILPTIADVLDVDTDWDFQGRSLFGDTPAPVDKPVFYGVGPNSVSLSLDGLYAVAARNHERFPEAGWRGVAAVGGLGRFVGEPVSALNVTDAPDTFIPDASWRLENPEALDDVQPGTGAIPLVIHGAVTIGGDRVPYAEALVAINGEVAGVAGDFVLSGPAWRFSALFDFEQIREGDNAIDLLLVAGGGDDPPFVRIPLVP